MAKPLRERVQSQHGSISARAASLKAAAGVVQRPEPQPSKLMMGVRFSSPARFTRSIHTLRTGIRTHSITQSRLHSLDYTVSITQSRLPGLDYTVSITRSRLPGLDYTVSITRCVELVYCLS